MAAFLTVPAKHSRQAEHSLQLAAGVFNSPKSFDFNKVDIGEVITSFASFRTHKIRCIGLDSTPTWSRVPALTIPV
jgi:hypothetical protein